MFQFRKIPKSISSVSTEALECAICKGTVLIYHSTTVTVDLYHGIHHSFQRFTDQNRLIPDRAVQTEPFNPDPRTEPDQDRKNFSYLGPAEKI